MRADGSAANKAAATSDAAAATSMSRAVHNGETFSAGDTVVISDAGEEYGGGIIPPSSGTLGNKINYTASGTPIANGYQLITGWTAEGTANVWKAAYVNADPRFVSVDLSVGTRYASDDLGSMDTNGDYAFDGVADEVYLYDDTNDPDTYSNPGIGGNYETTGLLIGSGISYVTIDGLRCRFFHQSGFYAGEPGPGITFSNCIGEYCYKGLTTGLNGGAAYTGTIIEDCIGRYNEVHGINPGWSGTNVTVRRCSAHHNGWTYNSEFTAGIKSFDSSGVFSGYNCYENECYSNGYDDGTAQQGDGAGIWLDATQGATGTNKIHHNYIHDNVGVGIYLEICKNSIAYGNVVHDNATTNVVGQSAANIVVDTRLDFISSGNIVYNNTVFGGYRGIKVDAYTVGACELNDNIVKNNICFGYSVCSIYCNNGGDNDAVHGSGNIYEKNCLGVEDTGFINWGGTGYDTYAAFKTAHGEAWDQVAGDPSFTDSGGDDYTLAAGSPCIGEGINLGSPYDAALMPTTQAADWPDSVVTGSQDDY